MAGVQPPTHDVFLLDLSESGTTKCNSVLLLEALHDQAIRTFTNENEEELLTPGGDEITPALVTAIEASKIAIVVLAGGFYDVSLRRWNVLAYILDYFQRNPERIIPVYYVDRSVAHADLFNFYGTLEKRKKYRERSKKDVYKMSKVLAQVDNLPGWDYHRQAKDIDEFERKIARRVSKMLTRAPSYVPVYSVGLESPLEELWRLMSLTSSIRNFLIIGFYGMPGIGKSTLARAVYHSIAHLFEASCFLDNIRERVNSNPHGLENVQKMLVSQISGKTRIQNVREEISMLKDGLHQKDVLLILDDVDSRDQLEALGRGSGWFYSPSSRVIITTRDKDLLTCHGNDMLWYDVRELNDEGARKLLSHKAFGEGNVDESYTQVLNRAIRYASGLPLVLDKIGSYMHGKSVDECQNALVRLKEIPRDDIQRIEDALMTVSNVGVTSQMDFKKWMLILVFVATNIAGLLCDFLSPHFESSIRWWTLVKFFPLVLFILAVMAVIKYVKWRLTISELIKCCICYGIFLFISVYSYFYERAVDGKPGTLSVVSNAMFALASLSLSRLFETGFETGIFNYFLQCFMIQLLTIHWWLIFVAIIVWFPFFDWHFSTKLPLITPIAEWFGINPVWNWNQNDMKAA